MRLELSVVLNHSGCTILVCCIILNTAGYLVVMDNIHRCVDAVKTSFVFLYFRLSRSSVVYLLCDFELPPSKVTPCWQTSRQTLAFTQIYISVLLRTFLTCSHVSYMSTITYFLSCLYCFLNAHISSYGLCSTFFSFLSLLLSLSLGLL